jgi:hypothetical protein
MTVIYDKQRRPKSVPGLVATAVEDTGIGRKFP